MHCRNVLMPRNRCLVHDNDPDFSVNDVRLDRAGRLVLRAGRLVLGSII